MVEAFVPKPTGPSGVPFIEVLESEARWSARAAGVLQP